MSVCPKRTIDISVLFICITEISAKKIYILPIVVKCTLCVGMKSFSKFRVCDYGEKVSFLVDCKQRKMRESIIYRPFSAGSKM